MALALADVLRRFGPAWLIQHDLSTAQAQAWRAILACRTEALGGQQWQCDGCGSAQWRWHSCRNRHCPRCQARSRDAWRQARMAEVLHVPYSHMVFTLPHGLNALARVHPRWVYETLMRCAAGTLTQLAGNERWLGATPGFSLVLHTWTQDLRLHAHVHALIACGGLRPGDDARAAQWVQPTRDARFLFPVHALSRVFRGKFIDALRMANGRGGLPRDPARTRAQQAQRLRELRSSDWVVYAKTPLGGPAAVLDYLSRYTHRTAIGHERLIGMDDRTVKLRIRARAAQARPGASRVISMDGIEFVGRFVQHVLPRGFKRIRHYGLLAPSRKARDLSAARAALRMPAPNPRALEQARDFMVRVAKIDIECCPMCKTGTLRLMREIAPTQPAMQQRHSQAARAPP